jgi:hypothetical protein
MQRCTHSAREKRREKSNKRRAKEEQKRYERDTREKSKTVTVYNKQ